MRCLRPAGTLSAYRRVCILGVAFRLDLPVAGRIKVAVMEQKFRLERVRILMRPIYVVMALFAGVMFIAPFLTSAAFTGEAITVVSLATTQDFLTHHHAPNDHGENRKNAHCGVAGCVAMNESQFQKTPILAGVTISLTALTPRAINAEHEPPPPRFG
jgi:hypothetical protein